VHTNFNCITLVGERVGRLSFIGQGAGSDPTGMALVEDLIDVTTGNAKTPVSLDDAVIDGTIHPHNYYIRTSLALSENIILHRLQQAVITHPMTPAEIHALYREIADKDPAAFVAGMDAGDAAAAALR
jgi:homoserine dehydrogenase